MGSHGSFLGVVALVLASSFQICLADCDALMARIEALEIQGTYGRTAFVLASSLQICLADGDALLARIEALEIQGKQQQDLLYAQNERLMQQEKTISTLLQWKQRLDQSSVGWNQASRDQAETTNKGGDDAKDMTKRVLGFSDEESSVRKDTVRPSRIVLGEFPVAFHAVIAKGDSPALGLHQKIVFEHVNLNLGNGYHNQHGLFIAPTPGLYMFSTSVMSHQHLDLSLVKNGVILACPYAQSASGTFDQGSVSVVAKLVAGDEIWVEERFDRHQIIYGDYYSSFMGYLITPL